MKINRRDFIKTGGMVMLGSLAAPSFLGSCTGNGTDQATGISFAQNHFGVSESDMKKVLTAALEKAATMPIFSLNIPTGITSDCRTEP